ncbi:MAG: hypothetical protein WCT20_00280 [Candidatus Babeliales bacterium]
MNIAILLDYWKKSLQFLTWQETRLALLASLNNFIKSLVFVARSFRWLVLLFIGSLVLAAVVVGYSIPSPEKLLFTASTLNALLTLFLSHGPEPVAAAGSVTIMKLAFMQIPAFLLLAFSCLALLFVYFLAARPSIEAKDHNYFRKYVAKFGMFCLFSVLWLYLGVGAFLMLFFFFDSGNSLRDISYASYRGLRCAVYFFPLIFIVWAAIRLTGLMLMLPFVALSSIISPLLCFYACYSVLFFMTLFAISVYSIYYVKIKHTFYQLFF